MTTSNTPARKAPADHQRSKADLIAEKEEPPAGHELLRPVTDMRSGDISTAQADIMQVFDDMGLDFKQAKGGKAATQTLEATPEVVRAMGRLGTVLEEFATDKAAFLAFDSGPGARQRMLKLGMWYMAALGE